MSIVAQYLEAEAHMPAFVALDVTDL
jgi:hypothetical protein